MKFFLAFNGWLFVAFGTIFAMSYFESQNNMVGVFASGIIGINLFVAYLFKVMSRI